MENVSSKVLLTATPLQNSSAWTLTGLVSMIDDRVFGDLDSFRAQFGAKATEQTLSHLASDSALFANVPYAAKYRLMFPILSALPSCKNLRHPIKNENFLIWFLNICPSKFAKQCQKGQRQLISLVLWKLLASSSRVIAGALDTMTKRLQGVLAESTTQDLVRNSGRRLWKLRWNCRRMGGRKRIEHSDCWWIPAIADEIGELKHFKTTCWKHPRRRKSRALLTALSTAFAKLKELGAKQKAIILPESNA